MAREILTSWSDYQAAADRLFSLAEKELLIHDSDLGSLRLESVPQHDALRRIAGTGQANALRVVVRNTTLLRRNHPRLMRLLGMHAQSMTLREIDASLVALRDTMILADRRYALIRFDVDQPRSKLLLDEFDEISPYLRRFEEIWHEGGTEIAFTTLGL